jgi:hypothetical protein
MTPAQIIALAEACETARRVLYQNKITWTDSPLDKKLDEAAAALRAMAEQQPIAWQYQDNYGKWKEFIDEAHRLNTIKSGNWPVRALYAAPVPAVDVDEAMRLADEFEIEVRAHERAQVCVESVDEKRAALAAYLKGTR